MDSPLRYPGGKIKIYNQVKDIIIKNNLFTKTYVEPFAGGFGIGLRLLDENIVNNVILNDFDTHIYNFWYSVLYLTEELCELIKNTAITIDERNWQRQIYYSHENTVLEDGFATLFLNRVNYSGIIKGGPIGGNRQLSKYKLDCRFNKQIIIQTIKRISEKRNQIKLFNLDASALILNVLSEIKEDIFLNIDPPYVVQGAKLYTSFFTEQDHTALSALIKEVLTNVPWLITYDDTPLIKTLYSDFQIFEYQLNYNVGKYKKGNELAIINKLCYNWQ